MAKVSADQAAAQWASRLSSSTERIKAGIQATTVSPGTAAARQKDVWATNVAAAKDKYASRVASVTLSEWQQAAIDKGLQRIPGGAQAAQPKFQAFMSQLLPYQDSLKGSLPQRGSLDQNIARMDQWVRGMSKFTRR